jgi:hypothetical protein
MPSPPLAMAEMPAAFVPIRLSTTVFDDDPASSMPFPRLPDITFAITPEACERFSPMKFPSDSPQTSTPLPPSPAAAPARFRPM